MKNIIIAYDDTVNVPQNIQTIIGKRSFGEIILKRQTMLSRIKRLVKDSKTEAIVWKISSAKDFDNLKKYPEDTTFFYLPSNIAVVNPDGANVLLQKLRFILDTTIICKQDEVYGAIFTNRTDFKHFIEEYNNQNSLDFVKGDKINTDIFIDLSVYDKLLAYISGGFDARYFNSLEGDNYTVTKRSADKKKMKMEYSYYWLLPERMKSFMVMPYDYREEEKWASYTMERMPMTDIAIRWTHGAVDQEEFRKIMDRVFYFFSVREEKQIDAKQYNKTADKLYLTKVDERIEKLKTLPEFKTIASLIKSGTDYSTIDEIIDEYKELYVKITKQLTKQKKYRSVIGHGDVFFANMLYSKETNLLRLIDPKGALKEADLWTDPYYDIAKLSHSVCGNYDFFNTGSFDISLDKDMHFVLNVHNNNQPYCAIFKEYLEKNGYNYTLVRLYESSLFLSMLPLHIDNPQKVFGFILNAINILKEVKENV